MLISPFRASSYHCELGLKEAEKNIPICVPNGQIQVYGQNRSSQSAETALTESHRLSGLNNRKLFSHGSGS